MKRKIDGWVIESPRDDESTGMYMSEDGSLSRILFDQYESALAELKDDISSDRGDFDDDLALIDFIKKDGWKIKPVCLVPPELMEWVEKTRVTLLEYQHGLSMLGYTKLAEGLEIVLVELAKILPEEK